MATKSLITPENVGELNEKLYSLREWIDSAIKVSILEADTEGMQNFRRSASNYVFVK